MAKKVEEQIPEIKTEEHLDSEFENFFEAAVSEPEGGAKETPAGAEKEAAEKEAAEKAEAEKAEAEKVEAERLAAEKAAEEKEDPRVAALEKELAEIKAAVAKKEDYKEDPKGPTEKEILAAQEDEKHMVAFAKDWPDHAKALEIMQKGLLSNVEKVLGDVLKPLFDKIPGLESKLTEVVGDKAIAIVESAHPDWKQMVPEIEKWIPSLPKYLQKAANDTLDNGSPEDMIELLNDFKEATGRSKAEKSAEELEKEKAEKEKTEKEKAGNKERLQAMASVKTARSTIDKGSDPMDFDGAFEEFVK